MFLKVAVRWISSMNTETREGVCVCVCVLGWEVADRRPGREPLV